MKRPEELPAPAKVLIIGAGSRGNGYARCISEMKHAVVHAIAEPIPFQKKAFGRRWIWRDGDAQNGQEFDGWRQFLEYETARRDRTARGESVEDGVDAVFVCTLDDQHAEIIVALAPLNLHVMCEKPLATTLDDCVDIYSSLLGDAPNSGPTCIFGIGHVLRYSPHNMLLRDLVLQQNVIGDIISIEHTEPVGWWHFSHSYVRGNWRKESTTAPSLLTKSCHDIDLLLWFLCSPTLASSNEPPHLPSKITSSGHLNYFKKSRKPAAAGNATNCLSCPVESSCMFSAKKIYLDRHLEKGLTDWPVKIVNPEIEDCYRTQGLETAKTKLLETLAEDYTVGTTPTTEIDARPWFGRCVWESANDVCDDQFVTITWDDEELPSAPDVDHSATHSNHFAKTASFHMIAQTEAQCERRGRIYGTRGEISYDSKMIRVYDFATGQAQLHHPHVPGGGHGGGDAGLASQFLLAVTAVKTGEMGVDEAQRAFVGCTLEEVVRSHALVFAAEEARVEGKVVGWREWWGRAVERRLEKGKGGGSGSPIAEDWVDVVKGRREGTVVS